MEEKIYYLGFSYFPGIGPKKFATLLATCGSAKESWHAKQQELQKIMGEKTAQRFIAFKEAFSFEKEIQALKQKSIDYIIPSENTYPFFLQKIPNAPFVIYYKGNTDNLLSERAIGIVGTRKVTSYGEEVTRLITRQLVAENFVTISGLALGVDSIVHKEAIMCHGKTIAVLGSGVDVCTPGINFPVYQAILASGGTIVSTFPPGTAASLGSFPARNRIIAGLSSGVVVTEGAEDSGALITARYAMEFKRPIFAIPGPITSALAKGVNTLLQQGAKLATNGDDIASVILSGTEAFLPQEQVLVKALPQHDKLQKGDSPEEQEIIDVLQLGTLHFDQIVRKIGKPAAQIGTILSMMEIKGQIKSDKEVYSLAI